MRFEGDEVLDEGRVWFLGSGLWWREDKREDEGMKGGL